MCVIPPSPPGPVLWHWREAYPALLQVSSLGMTDTACDCVCMYVSFLFISTKLYSLTLCYDFS